MPNRILKEGICTSDRINRLTAAQEVFFYRLLVQCDDYGRFDARPAILRARCYPLKAGNVGEAAVASLLDALERAGLVACYAVDGRPYLQISQWDEHQRVRSKRGKFPAPDGTRQHVTADDVRGPPESESLSESNPNPKGVLRDPNGFVVSPDLQARWKESFPGVDVPREVRLAWEWEQAHPDRRKVNLQAFLVRWLSKAQDQSRGRPNGDPPKIRPAILDEEPPVASPVSTTEFLARQRERLGMAR